MTPVIVLTKDRIHYLDLTLRSLSATLPDDVPVYIVDDGSENPDMHRYLTTTECIHLPQHKFPYEYSKWQQRVGKLPTRPDVYGIANAVHLCETESKSTGVRAAARAVREVFQRHACSAVFRIEDDVVFKAGWYETMVAAAVPRCGIISGFRHLFDKAVVTPGTPVDVLARGRVGGPLLLVSRGLYEKSTLPTELPAARLKNLDNFWVDLCRDNDLQVGVLRSGVCQHIGAYSSVYAGTRKEFIFGGRIHDALDTTVAPPFEIADSVRIMRG